MWVTRLLYAPGVELRRFVLLLTASIIVATFALVGPLSSTALAADATWNGTELTYEDNLYTEVTEPPNQPNLPTEYQWINTTTQPNTAHVLYFGPGNPGQATSATLITYEFSGTSYTTPSSPTTITVSRDPLGDPEGGQTANNTCTGQGGLGWVICPLSNYLADGIDLVYEIVANFFNVQTITQSDNGVFQFWKVMQSIANVAFIAVFMIIIYSQITGAGYSNYSIKDMIPRLILGAILVNISFWICALAVDASNLLGYSLQSILVNIRENIPTTADTGDITWSTFTTVVLAGGGVAGYVWASASVATSSTALGFILLTFLIPAALSALTAFIVLAARQALIVVLTAISPLAFVAFILPGTRDLFNKWRKLFTSMLIMFPAFALLFGGSQIAAAAIINTSEAAQGVMKFIIILVGLAVQVVPLALTPMLSRLSTGILGQITNMVNNKEKGLADRAKAWAQDNADTHKARKLTKMSNKHSDLQERLRQRQANGEKLSSRQQKLLNGSKYGLGRRALHMDQKKRERDAYKKLSEDTLSGTHERDWNARHNDPKSRLDRRTAAQRNTAYYTQKQAEREKNTFEGKSERSWNTYEDSQAGSYYRNLRTKATVDKGVAQKYEDKMEAEDKEALNRTIKETDIAEVVARTHRANKRAEAYENIVQKAAEKSWNYAAKNHAKTRALHLESVASEKQAGLSEQQLKTFVQEVETRGAVTPELVVGADRQTAQQLEASAATIKDTYLQNDISTNAENAAKREQQTDLAKFYKDEVNADELLKAGGIGGQAAANLVKARAFQTIVKNQNEGTEAEKTLLTKTDNDTLFNYMDDPNISVEQLAAYAGTIAKRGFHKDHNKLLYKASQMYKEAQASGNVSRQEDISDMIQQINADLSKFSFGISDRDRTLLAEGRYDTNNYISTRSRIISNLSPTALSEMDPDDLLMLYEMDRKGFLTKEQHNKIVETYEAWKEDKILGPKLRDKARNVLDRIKDPSIAADAVIYPDNPPPNVEHYGLTAEHFRASEPE